MSNKLKQAFKKWQANILAEGYGNPRESEIWQAGGQAMLDHVIEVLGGEEFNRPLAHSFYYAVFRNNGYYEAAKDAQDTIIEKLKELKS